MQITPKQLKAAELLEHYLTNIGISAAGSTLGAGAYNTFTGGPDFNLGAAALAGGLGGAARAGARHYYADKTGGYLHTPITEHFENKYLEDWV